LNAFFLKNLRHRPNQRIRVLPWQSKSSLASFQSRANRTENFVVLHLPGHHRALHTFTLHQFDRLAQLAKAHPVEPFRNFLQFRRSLFFQRDDRHFDTLAACALQNQERKSAVPAIRPQPVVLCPVLLCIVSA